MMNGSIMDLGPDTPQLEGTTWWKPDGTDHFTIRDILMAPEGFTIRTTDGRMINGDVMETYIQSEVPINIPKQAPVHKVNIKELDEVSQVEEVEDKGNFGSLKYNHDVEFAEPPAQRHHMKDPINDPIGDPDPTPRINSVEQAMIDRVLGRVNLDELVSVGINTIESVENGVVTLCNTLNVPRKEINMYLTNRIKGKIASLVQQSVDDFLNTVVPNPEEVTPETAE